jgi:glutathionylspermidine synthase
LMTKKESHAASSYRELRDSLYGPLREEGVFTWDTMYGEEYALPGLIRLEPGQLTSLRTAAEALGRVYAKTVQIVQQGEEALLLELGLPEAAIGTIRRRYDESVPTLIGRFDFALTPEGPKMLEFNSDTPTGIVEAFYVNGRVCEWYGEEDPNAGCSERLTQAFSRMLQLYRAAGQPVERVVFSALDWHEEDAGTTRYLMRASGIPGAEFVPLEELRVDGDLLWAPCAADEGRMQPVDVLYRLHALEKLAYERDTDGYPTGEHVLQLIADGRLAIINPPSGFAAQTKALQALIWSLHEAGEFFTEEEHAAITAYMLPTYLEPGFEAGSSYVAKPILGREGSGVTIFEAEGVSERSEEEEYRDQPMVYQQYAELPEIEVETANGPFRGRLLWGCFLIDGQASAVVARVGGKITSNMSYYLPSAVRGRVIDS